MSVYAFVQSSKNDGIDFFVKDGILIEDSNEAYRHLDIIDNFFKLASNQNRPTYIKNGNQHIFVGFHNKKDITNRRREFLISWSSNDNKDMVLKTAKEIGLTDEFSFDNLEKSRLNKNIMISILIIAIAVFIYKIY